MSVRLNNSIPADSNLRFQINPKKQKSLDWLGKLHLMSQSADRFFYECTISHKRFGYYNCNSCSDIGRWKNVAFIQRVLQWNLHHSCKHPIHLCILDWTEFGYECNLRIQYVIDYMYLYIHFFVPEFMRLETPRGRSWMAFGYILDLERFLSSLNEGNVSMQKIVVEVIIAVTL